ncbi:MAG: hypothetical protein WCP81_03360 [Actinomycetes bacterium]
MPDALGDCVWVCVGLSESVGAGVGLLEQAASASGSNPAAKIKPHRMSLRSEVCFVCVVFMALDPLAVANESDAPPATAIVSTTLTRDSQSPDHTTHGKTADQPAIMFYTAYAHQ